VNKKDPFQDGKEVMMGQVIGFFAVVIGFILLLYIANGVGYIWKYTKSAASSLKEIERMLSYLKLPS